MFTQDFEKWQIEQYGHVYRFIAKNPMSIQSWFKPNLNSYP